LYKVYHGYKQPKHTMVFCFEVQGDLGKVMTDLSQQNDTHLKKVVKSDTKIIFFAIYDNTLLYNLSLRLTNQDIPSLLVYCLCWMGFEPTTWKYFFICLGFYSWKKTISTFSHFFALIVVEMNEFVILLSQKLDSWDLGKI